MTLNIIAASLALALAAHLIRSQVRHVRWCKEGDRLAAQFEQLMRDRETYIDPLVGIVRGRVGRKAMRGVIEAWFARMDEHQAQRQRHLDDWRAM